MDKLKLYGVTDQFIGQTCGWVSEKERAEALKNLIVEHDDQDEGHPHLIRIDTLVPNYKGVYKSYYLYLGGSKASLGDTPNYQTIRRYYNEDDDDTKQSFILETYYNGLNKPAQANYMTYFPTSGNVIGERYRISTDISKRCIRFILGEEKFFEFAYTFGRLYMLGKLLDVENNISLFCTIFSEHLCNWWAVSNKI